MKAKKSVKLFLSLVLASIILLFSALYIYDPLQIFHKPWGRDITFHKNMRQQAAGIINNYEFDSIILGTSMLENTSANEASEIFGGTFANLSMSASDFYERKIILEYLFEKKNINTIIYSLDSDKYIYQNKGNRKYPIKTYSYLYDNNPFNDIDVYMNNKFIKCISTLSTSKQCIGDRIGLDRPGAWFRYKSHSARYGGLEKWFAAKNNNQIKAAFRTIIAKANKIKLHKTISLKGIEKKIEKAKVYVDETVLSMVKKHPKTQFLMVFPPYSRMYYAMWAQYNLPAYEIHKAIVKYLATESDNYPNLKIYAYGDQKFVDEIKNYKDPKHYHVSINKWILNAIKEDIGQINSKNVNRYIETVTRKNKNYDLVKLGKKIDHYLKSGK